MIRFNVTESLKENARLTPASPLLTSPPQMESVVVIMGYILSVGSVLIISTNLLVATALVFLIRKKGYQSWCFVLNLAIADALVGVAITAIATDSLSGRTTSIPKDTCLLRMSFVIAPSAGSILTMFLISLDRYVAIKFPLRYSQLMSEKATIGMLVPLWLVSATVGFLPSIVEPMQQKHYVSICSFFSVIEPHGIIVLFCAFFFPLLSIFIYFYMDILKIACGHQKRIYARQVTTRFLPSSRYWGHVKALRTVATLVGCFTLCWCPFFVVSIVQVLCPTCKLYRFLENHLWVLGLSNSLINPLVYACWQREVRSQICELFAQSKAWICCLTQTEGGNPPSTVLQPILQVKLQSRTLLDPVNCSRPVTTCE